MKRQCERKETDTWVAPMQQERNRDIWVTPTQEGRSKPSTCMPKKSQDLPMLIFSWKCRCLIMLDFKASEETLLRVNTVDATNHHGWRDTLLLCATIPKRICARTNQHANNHHHREDTYHCILNANTCHNPPKNATSDGKSNEPLAKSVFRSRVKV